MIYSRVDEIEFQERCIFCQYVVYKLHDTRIERIENTHGGAHKKNWSKNQLQIQRTIEWQSVAVRMIRF